MDDTDMLRARVTALSDRGWMYADELLADIQRVAAMGPSALGDDLLIRWAFGFLAAELYARRAARYKDDEETARG